MENAQSYIISHVTLVYSTNLPFLGKLFRTLMSLSHLLATSPGLSIYPPQPTAEIDSSLSYRKPSSKSITRLFELIFPPQIAVLRIVCYVGSISPSPTHPFSPLSATVMPRNFFSTSCHRSRPQLLQPVLPRSQRPLSTVPSSSTTYPLLTD